MKKIRVRYAPSPTGSLHIGNARSALFNYLFARHFGGDFIVRIEDTDVSRNVVGGEDSQLRFLKWLGLDWDEAFDVGGDFGPYRQLERLDLYKKYAEQLLQEGLAYKEYRDDNESFAIRFRVPSDVRYIFKDIVRGELKFESKDVEDWIIMKENGIPTYNFAVVIDDYLMKISHVLRGEEHITNTPKQIMIFEAFKWSIPTYGHMTIIVNQQKKKLSKRDKNTVQFISEYHELGYLPEAMFNFIALLGWSPQGNKEILSKEAIIKQFDPKRLAKAPAMFDKEKLAYINSRYIKKMDIDILTAKARPYLEAQGVKIINESWLKLLVSLFQDRMTHIGEIPKLYQLFFHSEFNIDTQAYQFLIDNNSLSLLETFYKNLKNSDFSASNIENIIKEVGKQTDTKGKPLFMSLRIATTGDQHGPSLPVSLELLEKEKVLTRLNKTIRKIRGDI